MSEDYYVLSLIGIIDNPVDGKIRQLDMVETYGDTNNLWAVDGYIKYILKQSKIDKYILKDPPGRGNMSTKIGPEGVVYSKL